MKTIFRFLSLGILATGFVAATASTSFAQDPCADVDAKTALYGNFTKNYNGKTLPELEAALNAAKEYVGKYGACEDDKQQVTYFNDYIPKAQKNIDAIRIGDTQGAVYKRFNEALKTKNWDQVYAAGKEVLSFEKDPATILDVTIVLGSIGFDETFKKNEKYNADTLKYAKDAIQKIEANQTSKQYGVAAGTSGFVYKDKENALASLNYIVGYLNYNTGAKDKKAALPYLYKSTQYNSALKKSPDAYQGIGSYYLEEMVRLETDRQAKLKAANNVDTDETKAIFALQKGYAERVLDAYSKAYKLIDPAKEKARRDQVFTNLKTTYEFRNNGKTTGFDEAYISSLAAKPMPDPATAVTPIVETPAEPATPTTDTNTSSTAKPAASTTTSTTAKPATKPTPSTATKP